MPTPSAASAAHQLQQADDNQQRRPRLAEAKLGKPVEGEQDADCDQDNRTRYRTHQVRTVVIHRTRPLVNFRFAAGIGVRRSGKLLDRERQRLRAIGIGRESLSLSRMMAFP